MKINRLIKFTGKNLNDVFGLPCVKCILKVDEEPLLVLWPDMVIGRDRSCAIGGILVEYENHQWKVER
jgi:hypothetical protein